jgi:hypothetical protein
MVVPVGTNCAGICPPATFTRFIPDCLSSYNPMRLQSCGGIPSLIKCYPISLTFWFVPIQLDMMNHKLRVKLGLKGKVTCFASVHYPLESFDLSIWENESEKRETTVWKNYGKEIHVQKNFCHIIISKGSNGSLMNLMKFKKSTNQKIELCENTATNIKIASIIQVEQRFSLFV